MSFLPTWFKTLRIPGRLSGLAYFKEGRVQLSEDQARKVRCRGDARAARRRMMQDSSYRWRAANVKSFKFRLKIVARLEEARRLALAGRSK